MKFKKYSQSYRQELENLSKQKEFNNPSLFKKIVIPVGLKVYGSPNPRINCHGYTFGVDEKYPQTEIAKKITKGTLVKLKNPKENCIILYFYMSPNSPLMHIRHSGFYIGKGRVMSKWGEGPVLAHKVFSVPTNYSSCIEFYEIRP